MLQADESLPEGAPEGLDGADGADGDARVAAFDAALAEVAARVAQAYQGADGWLAQTRAGLVELLRFCDERPDTARALVVESIAWGPAVLERRGQVLDVLVEALDRGRAQTAPPPGTAENLVGACISLVHTRLMRERAGSFVELAPSLMSTIAHPYLGPEAARRELERPLARVGKEAVALGSQRSAATSSQRNY